MIYNKKNESFDLFELFEDCVIFGMYFGILGVLCIINCYFDCFNRILCLFSVYMEII